MFNSTTDYNTPLRVYQPLLTHSTDYDMSMMAFDLLILP